MVDHVIRFENLADEWPAVAGKLGLPGTLPHINKSERGSYRDYYSPVLRRLAERCFSRDLERFDYSFDGPAKNSTNHNVMK